MNAAGWLFSALGLIVLSDLVSGLRTGRMNAMLRADRNENSRKFYALVAFGIAGLVLIAYGFLRGDFTD